MKEYNGGYSDYEIKRREEQAQEKQAQRLKGKSAGAERTRTQQRPQKPKFSFAPRQQTFL